MRILHTSDWHIGKKIGRFDRHDEYREVIDEVVETAEREQVDLVVHSGDVFDRPFPPMEALRLGLEGLDRLTDGGRRPVVAIAGNHDSPSLFETLAGYLAARNVHLVGRIKPPDEGGVIELNTPGGRAVVSCFPFLREGKAFHAWTPPGEQYKKYADRLRGISQAYARAADEKAGQDGVTLLAAHFLVGGAKVYGRGAPRGERELHMGEVYAADSMAIPAGPQYAALGHIHAPQRVPGAVVPAEYAGSLLELDFGEAGEEKRVVLVDVEPGLPAEVRPMPITGGRRLLRPEGTWEEIEAMDGLDEAYLDLTVHTAGPDPGLADRARERFPYLVKVRAEYERAEPERRSREGRAIPDLYGDYYLRTEGVEPPEDLLEALRKLLEEEAGAPA